MLENIAKNSEVKIEQLSHEFKFGAHLFNYNQLGKTEYNERYKELYGTLFNSGTIAFYWRKFESLGTQLQGALMGKDGKRFMVPIHELAELAPRDIVARSIYKQENRCRVRVRPASRSIESCRSGSALSLKVVCEIII